MQVFLDRRQRNVDNRYVHTHDQQAHAADRKNQVWMGGAARRINDGSARRACSRKKSILSFRQGVSSRLVFSPRNAVSLNALSRISDYVFLVNVEPHSRPLCGVCSAASAARTSLVERTRQSRGNIFSNAKRCCSPS